MYYIKEKKQHTLLWSLLSAIVAIAVCIYYVDIRLETKKEPFAEDETVSAAKNTVIKQKDAFEDINKYKTSVVYVTGADESRNGFFISRDGYVLSSGFEKEKDVKVTDVFGAETEGAVIWEDTELDICIIKTDKEECEFVSLEGYANVENAGLTGLCSINRVVGFNVVVENVASDAFKKKWEKNNCQIRQYLFNGTLGKENVGMLAVDSNSNPVGITVDSTVSGMHTVLPFQIAGAVAKNVMDNGDCKYADLGIAFEDGGNGTVIKITDETKKGYESGLRDGDRVRFINRREIKNCNDAVSELLLCYEKTDIVFSTVRGGDNDEIRIIL